MARSRTFVCAATFPTYVHFVYLVFSNDCFHTVLFRLLHQTNCIREFNELLSLELAGQTSLVVYNFFSRELVRC